ncbi:hypothetical protein MMB68_10400 [Priestia sp. Y58]|uniref:hypothetical protein n=1 Tax=Priestia sp. Y58 TaxID=2922804 RepID=UPI002406D2B2|nr:hypothetical protein [Priestia sp. Y58]MDG0029966.1 hypothetical protein [Priestia sp. Y58]
MKSLFIKSLFIFELKNKIAKRVNFEKGINVITSEKEGGNDVGKSILLKSLYHTLGADSIFDDKWDESTKIYLIHIDIKGNEYYIYRNIKLFKVFSKDFKNLFNTSNRTKLSSYLNELYGFCVKLPNRESEELEITPPVYSYLLNYIDQDHMNGSNFTSFKSLSQYANYKENVIYNHFGVFTKDYFEALKEIERLKKEEKTLLEEKLIIESMLKRVKYYLEGIDAPTEKTVLDVELEKSKQEYTDLVVKLKKAKNGLIALRNEKIDLENDIDELIKFKKIKEGNVQKVNENLCPTCSQHITDIGLRISENSELEDFYIIKDQIDGLILEVERKLEIKEKQYTKLLNRFNQFEREINVHNVNISDVLKHRGYLETHDNMIKEFGKVENKLTNNSEEVNLHQKTLAGYNKLKKKANELYKQYMSNSIMDFGLEEISMNKVKNIKSNFTARGSNVPISTIIWYFNLLKVKYELNGDSIKFPLILDSPNNVELDENKRKALFNYIFTNNDKDTQLIVSTLGFDEKDYEDITVDKVIILKNAKYSLLNSKDYEDNKDILEKVFNA